MSFRVIMFPMCYNCGCGNPRDDMGDPENITEETFINLANAFGVSIHEAKNKIFQLLEEQKESNFRDIKGEDPNITELFERSARAWGQSVVEARKYTYEQLRYEMKK